MNEPLDDSVNSVLSTPSAKVCRTPGELWTPGCWEGDSDDDLISPDANNEEGNAVLKALNKAMEELTEALSLSEVPKISLQLIGSWEDASEEIRNECVQKAAAACKLVCHAIAPDAGDELYKSLPEDKPVVSKGLTALMTAFANAPTRNLRTQILSIYAFEYPMKQLQALHEPFARVSLWQIKRARSHAQKTGPGVPVIKARSHRVNLDMNKVDHFVDFVNRPYFHQDVAFGIRKIKLGVARC